MQYDNSKTNIDGQLLQSSIATPNFDLNTPFSSIATQHVSSYFEIEI